LSKLFKYKKHDAKHLFLLKPFPSGKSELIPNSLALKYLFEQIILIQKVIHLKTHIFIDLMRFYIYIIQSEIDQSYYKGFSENYLERLKQHNDGWSKYTSRKKPWKLVYVELFESRSEALKREKTLKKYSRSQILILIQSQKNLLKNA
jgi:putative endonuclease